MTERPKTADYKTPVGPDDDLMTVEEYLAAVKAGAIIDYDGMGAPVRDGLEAEMPGTIWIYPSQGVSAIPQDATHINWFNR